MLTPLVVPLPSSDVAKKLNRALLIKQVRRALRKVGKGPVQFWTFTPDVGYLLGAFEEEKVIYYCVDDHSQFTGYDVDQVLAEEEDLCRRSDLVITTSMALQEAKKGFNENTVLIPHGVDYAHFSKALDESTVEAPELQGIPHPRIGFFGLLRDWVDLDMVAAVAKRRPTWQFVMVGDATFDLSTYRSPNIHFLGRKPYDSLPGYCKGFDIGIIPFKINDLTLAVNPIKLREYLAAGLPVVSTPLPEVAIFQHHVGLANSADEFESAIERFLSEDAGELVKERSAAMSSETWPAIVDRIGHQLQR
ncbi:glycosyltransferase [Rhodopirellula sp. JC639]|uniref:glycosyltransferase n=1 Tax=Stieleria mannarensis TaxID=2755585 RepID=UPI001C7193A8